MPLKINLSKIPGEEKRSLRDIRIGEYFHFDTPDWETVYLVTNISDFWIKTIPVALKRGDYENVTNGTVSYILDIWGDKGIVILKVGYVLFEEDK